MNHPLFKILGYSEAAMFLRAASKPNVGAIISIHGAREFGVEADVVHRLDLKFDDVEVESPGDVMSLHRVINRRRWAEQNGLVEIAPVAADAAAIIEFAANVRECDGIVLCHCAGGMSRAPAAALICLALWCGPGKEDECAQQVFNLRRGAVPHVGLTRLADELLGREGRLVRALVGRLRNG